MIGETMGKMKAAGTAISPTNADLTSEFAIYVSGDNEIPAERRSVISCSRRYSLSLMWREIHAARSPSQMSMCMLICFMLMYLLVIGMQIVTSLGGMFG